MTGLTNISTKSDKTVDEWAMDDDVVRLRDWATETIRPLPRPPVDECTVGAAETCALRIDDRSGRVSRLHARLVRDQGKLLRAVRIRRNFTPLSTSVSARAS